VSGHPTVLVVDDERDIADTYAAMLGESYDVRVAYGGEGALDAIDDDVDAVLLDRRMPDVSGDVVLERVREAGYGCKVIMVTAIDPDLDILAMDFDDYLCKPIKRDTLLQAVDQQLDFVHDPNRKLDEFFKLVSTLEVLEERLPADRLDDHEEYKKHRERAEQLGAELSEEMSDFRELVHTFREINRSTE